MDDADRAFEGVYVTSGSTSNNAAALRRISLTPEALAADLAGLGWYAPIIRVLAAADLAALNDGSAQIPYALVDAPGANKIEWPEKFIFINSLNGGISAQLVTPSSYVIQWGDGSGEDICSGQTGIGDVMFHGDTSNQFFPFSLIGGAAPRPLLRPGPFMNFSENVNVPIYLRCNAYTVVPGAIATDVVTAGNAGLGYVPSDTGTVDDTLPGGVTAVYVIDTVDGDGAVLTFHLAERGTGYTISTANTTTPTSGGGSGFRLDTPVIDYSVNQMTVTVISFRHQVPA